MLSTLSPKKWVLFKMNQHLFYDLQANLSKSWHNILVHLRIDDKEIESAITLLPSSIIICEALFKDNIENVQLLRNAKHLDYNTILKRLTKLDIFDISKYIAKVWHLPESVGTLILASSGIKPSADEKLNKLAKWMHLLLFYELSKPQFIEAGLNDFVEFNVEYVMDIYENFMQLMEVQS